MGVVEFGLDSLIGLGAAIAEVRSDVDCGRAVEAGEAVREEFAGIGASSVSRSFLVCGSGGDLVVEVHDAVAEAALVQELKPGVYLVW